MNDAHLNRLRTRWAAVGAAVAITLGAGGIGIANATQPAGAVAFVPITPCRIFDTRPEPAFSVGPRDTPLGPGDIYTVTAHGSPGKCANIPTSATGLSMNVTTVGATLDTFLTIWPTGKPQPNSSSLNPSPDQPPTPNAVTTALSPTGQFDIYNLQGHVHVIADVNGYYADHNHDDRYLRAGVADSITLAGGGFVPRNGNLTTTTANAFCYRPATQDEWMSHSVPVPAGSTVTGITVHAKAETAQNYYLLITLRRPGAAVVDFINTTSTTPYPAGPGVTSASLTLQTPTVIGPGDSLMLTFVQNSTGPKTVELCSAQVQFTRPG